MTYEPLLPARQHQAAALSASRAKRYFALRMAQRVGKTKVVLDNYGELELAGQCKDLLVIAPAGAYREWETEVSKHCSRDLQHRAMVLTWASKATSQTAQRLEAAFMAHSGPRVLLMNVEALSTVQRARALCRAFIGPQCMLAVDESTTIKNPASKRSRFVLEHLGPRVGWRRILTGLIAPRSPLDLFAQYKFLDTSILGYDNIISFKRRYAIEEFVCMWPNEQLTAMLAQRGVRVNGMDRLQMLATLRRYTYVPMISIVKGYQHEDELYQKTAPHSYRATLAECYDMPAKQYMIRNVTMTTEQARLYRELRDFATTELASMDHVTATHVLTRMLRLHQILCGHTKDEQGNVHAVPSNRVTALLDLLEEIEGKVVIWCSYQYDVQQISVALRAAYGDLAVVHFWGGNVPTREEEQRRFQTDPQVRFMVATPSAGGRGRDWAVADTVIYYSNTDNLEYRMQSEERAQAVGKRNSVAYIDLMVPNTVDKIFVQNMRDKINMSTRIDGANYIEWLI